MYARKTRKFVRRLRCILRTLRCLRGHSGWSEAQALFQWDPSRVAVVLRSGKSSHGRAYVGRGDLPFSCRRLAKWQIVSHGRAYVGWGDLASFLRRRRIVLRAGCFYCETAAGGDRTCAWTHRRNESRIKRRLDAWVGGPACSLDVLVKCPCWAVDIQRATWEITRPLHPLSLRSVWNSPPRRRVQVWCMRERPANLCAD